VKRSGRNEPKWVAIHMYMEAMLGISLYSYLHLKLQKRYVFLIFSYVFSSTKSENRRENRTQGERGKVAEAIYTVSVTSVFQWS
jgi:hypothetical protein